jgi:hypothetical protein
MKIQKFAAVAKQDHTKADAYNKLWVLRLFRDEENGNKVVTVKKCIFLSEVVSFEEGHSTSFDWDGPTMYVICETESFYCAGDVKEFEKEMDRFIKNLRENAEE